LEFVAGGELFPRGIRLLNEVPAFFLLLAAAGLPSMLLAALTTVLTAPVVAFVTAVTALDAAFATAFTACATGLWFVGGGEAAGAFISNSKCQSYRYLR
jgi:hypothetical protein